MLLYNLLNGYFIVKPALLEAIKWTVWVMLFYTTRGRFTLSDKEHTMYPWVDVTNKICGYWC